MVGPRRLALAGVALVLFADPAAAAPDPLTSPSTRAMASFTTTLVVGAVLAFTVPVFTKEVVERVIHDPGEAFFYGLVVFVSFLLAIAVLAATILGLYALAPLAVTTMLVGIVGSSLGHLSVAFALLGMDQRWSVAVVVASLVSSVVVAVPVVGDVAGILMGALGTGAAAVHLKVAHL